jgi:hypothetical protein
MDMHGSAARSWSIFDNAQRELEAEYPEIIEQPSVRRITEKTKIPVMHLARYIVVFAVLAFIMFSFSQVWAANSVNNALRDEYNLLLKENVSLMQQNIGGMSLRDIEQIARDEFNMVPPSQHQIIYIRMNGQDHAVVYSGQTWWRQLWLTLSGVFK